MLRQIIQSIKSEIVSRLIGSSILYHGQQKRLTRFVRWWDPGFNFENEIDLASIPVNGPQTTNVRFNLWANMEIDSDHGKQANINAHFGPINISFVNGRYQPDFSNAQFTMMEVE